MYKSKRYEYDYDDYEEGDKSAETMIADIIADEDFPSLEGIIIGSWGDAWDDSCQTRPVPPGSARQRRNHL